MPAFARRSLLALTVLTTLFSAPDAWAKKKKKAEPAPVEAPASGVSGEQLAANMPTSMNYTVALIDAGAEPRRPLRLAPAAGSVQAIEMVMDMNMSMAIGEQAQKMDTPPMAMGMQSTVNRVDPDGSFHVDTLWLGAKTLPGGDAPPEMAEVMAQAFALLDGLQMRQHMDPTGRSLAFEITGSASPEIRTAMSGIQDSMRQSQVYLPAEPIGVGGKWKMTLTMVSGGIPVEATTIYTVRAIDGDVLTLGNEINMSADASALLASLPPGAKASMDLFTASGGGELRWDLAELYPTGTIAYKMHMAMSADAEGVSMPIVMDLDYSLEMRRGK